MRRKPGATMPFRTLRLKQPDADVSIMPGIFFSFFDIKPDISKTGQYRQVIIRPALAAWLTRYGLDILPTGYDRHLKAIRKEMQLGHDVLRHTFFSIHVAKHKSVGEAALEGGNTEAVLKKHYLNLATYNEGDEFWGIVPEAPAKKIIPISGSISKATASRNTA